MTIKVALAGATGNLGPAILKALLDAGFEVTILSRTGSNSTDSLPKHFNQKIVKVDYTNVKELTAALQGIEAVVASLTGSAFDVQKPLIDAAVAAGVKRFIPSEFGSDMTNPLNQKLPVFKGKVDTTRYLEQVSASKPSFTYTLANNNLFFDWGFQVGFIVNAKEHKAALYDGGDVPISMTRLSTIGKAVVGILNNQEATKNRTVLFHDAARSLNQLIGIIKGIDGKEWETEYKSTAEIEKDAYAELQKENPSIEKAMYGFLYRAAFSKDHQPDFTSKAENKLLGIPELGEEEVVEIVKGLL